MKGQGISCGPTLRLSFLAIVITALRLHAPYFARPGTKAVLHFPPQIRTSGITKKKKFYILKLSATDYLSDTENDLFLFSWA